MSLTNLTDEEYYALLKLSYIDINPDIIFKNNQSLTLEQFINEAIYYNEDNDFAIARLEEVKKVLEKSQNLENVKLIAYANHNPNEGNNVNEKSTSGFVGYAFEDENGNRAALFRGSEDMTDPDHFRTDWESNVEASFGKEIEQQREAKAFYEKYVIDASGDKLLLGHSKGGNLLTHVFVHYYEDSTLHAYVVNGQPYYWEGLTEEQQKSLMGDNYTFIVHEGDIVSALGETPYIDKIVKIKDFEGSTKEKVLFAHNLESVTFKENGEFSEWTDKPSTLRGISSSIINKIIVGINNINDAISYIKDKTKEGITQIKLYLHTLTKSVFKIINDILDGFVEKAKRFVNIVVNGLEKLGNFSKKLIDATKSFFDDLIESVAKLRDKFSNLFGGSSVATEPFIQVQLPRTSYYVSQLEQVRNRINYLSSSVYSLRGKTTNLFAINSVIWKTSSLIYRSNSKIHSNIKYLNEMASRLEKNERNLIDKANSLKF